MEIRSRLKLFCNSIDVNDKEVNFPRGINEYYVAPYVENDSCSYSLYTPVNHEEVFCVDESAGTLYLGAKCVYISCHLYASSACVDGRFSACAVQAEIISASKCLYVNGNNAVLQVNGRACITGDIELGGNIILKSDGTVNRYVEIEGSIGTTGCACIGGELKVARDLGVAGGACIGGNACIANFARIGSYLCVNDVITIDKTGISGVSGLYLSGNACGCVDLAIKGGNITIGCGETTESVYFHKSTHFMEGCHIFYGFPTVSTTASPGMDEQLVPKSYVDQLAPYHLEQTNSSAISGTGQTWKIVLSSYTGTNLPQITLYDKDLNIIHTDTNYNKTTKTVTFTFSGTVDFSAGDLTASILAIK